MSVADQFRRAPLDGIGGARAKGLIAETAGYQRQCVGIIVFEEAIQRIAIGRQGFDSFCSFCSFRSCYLEPLRLTKVCKNRFRSFELVVLRLARAQNLLG